MTLAYAASGQLPFGTGSADAVLYRILHAEPDTAAVPELLRPLVLASLAKDPQRRPRADELLARLTNQPRAGRDSEFGTQAVLAQTWAVTEAAPVQQPAMPESVLLEPAPAGTRRPRRAIVSRRSAAIGGPALAIIAAAVIFALTGHAQNSGQLTANQQQDTAVAAGLGTYPGQQHRGVSQTVDRVVASGNTIVTMGSQSSDGVTRQQFFASTDGGASWRLASVHASGGGAAPLGHAATRLAGGPGGWLAVGPQAIWTSADGLSWTLASTSGVPQLPGDQLLVLNSTAHGFLAAGVAAASGGVTQAVIWTSQNGLTWAAPDRRAAGPDRRRRSRAGHHLRRLARQRHGYLRRDRQRRLRDLAEHRRRVDVGGGYHPRRPRGDRLPQRPGLRRIRPGRGAARPGRDGRHRRRRLFLTERHGLAVRGHHR